VEASDKLAYPFPVELSLPGPLLHVISRDHHHQTRSASGLDSVEHASSRRCCLVGRTLSQRAQTIPRSVSADGRHLRNLFVFVYRTLAVEKNSEGNTSV
jgi:hypothetical protein